MARWEDQGVILEVHRFGDHDVILSIFCAERGLRRGVLKGGLRAKYRASIEPGTVVQAEWYGRLDEHLGKWSMEPLDMVAAKLMHARTALVALNSLCALLRLSLAEADPHPRLYGYLQHMLHTICASPTATDWVAEYVKFELLLLEETGFGLDLTQCAVTGSADDLQYISPKSGRAVGAIAGKPFHSKLLPFPNLFRGANTGPQDAMEAIGVTGHFLHHWLLASIHKPLPAARLQLAEMLSKSVQVA
jgi:DNA repair protein RecO (recombination protein O)